MVMFCDGCEYQCFSCQFIVREGEDYSVHSADPDRLVDWDLVEQVVSIGLSIRFIINSHNICLD